jgi:hypothetical protein
MVGVRELVGELEGVREIVGVRDGVLDLEGERDGVIEGVLDGVLVEVGDPDAVGDGDTGDGDGDGAQTPSTSVLRVEPGSPQVPVADVHSL